MRHLASIASSARIARKAAIYQAAARAEVLEPRRLLAADATITYSGISLAPPTAQFDDYSGTISATTAAFSTWTIHNLTNSALSFNAASIVGIPVELTITDSSGGKTTYGAFDGLHSGNSPFPFAVPASGSATVALSLISATPGTYRGSFNFSDATVSGGYPSTVSLTAVPDGTSPTKQVVWSTASNTNTEPQFTDTLAAYSVFDDAGNLTQSQTFDAAFFTLPENSNSLAASFTAAYNPPPQFGGGGTDTGISIELLPDKHPGSNKLYADDFEQPITSAFAPVGSTNAAPLNQTLNQGSYVLYISSIDPDGGGGQSIQFNLNATITATTPPQISVSDSKGTVASSTSSQPSTAAGTSFGTIPTGSAASATLLTFTVKNSAGSGAANLVFAPSSDGPNLNNDNGFQAVSSLTTGGAGLAPGGTQTFSVELTSTALKTAGAKSALVDIVSSAGADYQFLVGGTVAAPAQVPALSILGSGNVIANNASASASTGTSFGSVTQGTSPALVETYTVKNTGNAALSITSGPSVTGPFSIVGTPLASNIPAGGSASFQVQLNDGAVGPANGTVTLVSNDPTNGTFKFALAATVAAVPVPAISVVGNGNAISNNASASSSTGTNFGSVVRESTPALTRTFTVNNTGNATLTISSGPSVTGPFSIVGTPLGSTIAAGKSGTFTVQLNDITPGTASGTVTLVSNDPNAGTFKFALAATITVPQIPVLSILGNATSIANNAAASATTGTNFGSVTQNASPAPIKTFTVQNTGTQPLTITGGPSVTGPFSIVGTPLATSIPGGSSGTFQVQFNDSATGPANGTVTLFSNDPANGAFKFAVAGNVLNAGLTSGGLKIKAEDVNGAVTKGATVKIYPTGSTTAVVQAKTNSNGLFEDASLTAGTYDVELYSAAGNLWATQAATVGNSIKSLTVKENLPLEVSLKAYIAKTGAAVKGTVKKGTPLLFKVTVKNISATAQSSRVLLSLKYGPSLLLAFSQTSSHKSLAPGASAAFSFTYTPTVTGSVTANFIVETLLSGSYVHTNSGTVAAILKLA